MAMLKISVKCNSRTLKLFLSFFLFFVFLLVCTEGVPLHDKVEGKLSEILRNSLSSYLGWFRLQNVKQRIRGDRRVSGLSLIAMTRPASCCRSAGTSGQSEQSARIAPVISINRRRAPLPFSHRPLNAEEPRPSAFLSVFESALSGSVTKRWSTGPARTFCPRRVRYTRLERCVSFCCRAPCWHRIFRLRSCMTTCPSRTWNIRTETTGLHGVPGNFHELYQLS